MTELMGESRWGGARWVGAALAAALTLSGAPVAAQTVEGTLEAAQDAAGAAAEAAQDVAEDVAEGASEAAESAAEAVEGAVDAATEALTGETAAAEAEPVDFSEGSQAREWGLPTGEVKARFSAKVVDILCELTGDCPENCGDRRRQLGLLREADGKLILPAKNAQPIFTGAVVDLTPYCGQTVEVDGVLVNEDLPAPLYLVQRVKGEGAEDWAPTNRFSQVWIAENQDVLNLPGRWFNKDPRVTSRIEKEGRLGLGLEADKAFAEEWF